MHASNCPRRLNLARAYLSTYFPSLRASIRGTSTTDTTVRFPKLFIRGATDTEIWGTVFTLIQTVYQRTSPSSIHPSFKVKSVRFSSTSQQGNEQTASLLKSRIFDEIKGVHVQICWGIL